MDTLKPGLKGTAELTVAREHCTSRGGPWVFMTPAMVQFYDQLYQGIELYSEYLGTRDPAWHYKNIYGQSKRFVYDPFQLLGFLYTPTLLTSKSCSTITR